MPTTDGAIEQKLFYDLEWIYYCLLPKTISPSKRQCSKRQASLNVVFITPHYDPGDVVKGKLELTLTLIIVSS